MTRLLAIETSGPAMSVALAENGAVIAEVYYRAGFIHSEKLIPSVERLFAETGWAPGGLDAVAVSTGPGSFTGIRVGLTCARVLCQSLSLPLIGVSSLDILAAGVPPGGYEVMPVIDAQRGEVFVKSAEEAGAEILPLAALATACRKTKAGVLFIGSGVEAYREHFVRFGKRARLAAGHLNYPRAGVLAAVASGMKGQRYDRVKPLYIRKSWAEESKKK